MLARTHFRQVTCPVGQRSAPCRGGLWPPSSASPMDSQVVEPASARRYAEAVEGGGQDRWAGPVGRPAVAPPQVHVPPAGGREECGGGVLEVRAVRSQAVVGQ